MNRWRPIIGGLSVNLALGSLYAWSVFVLPLEQEFGWTRSQTSWVYTIAIQVTVIATLIGGRLQDRRGPRAAALVGGMLFAGGFLFSSWATSLLALYLSFGVVVGFGNGCGYSAPMPVASKWFPDMRGLIVGLMMAGFAAGSAIVGPLATVLMEQYGWRATFRMLAAAFFAMTLVGVWLLQNPPAGYRPPGWVPQKSETRPGRDVSTARMMRLPTFWALWVAFCFGSMAGQMAISQLVPFARSAGLGIVAASLAIPVAAAGNIGGRVLSGWLSDRLGRIATLRLMILVSAVVMPSLYLWREHAVLFFILVAAVYWCYGTQFSVFASTTADFYGTKHLGLNFGVLMTAWGVAGAIAPFMAGWVFDRFHSYEYAFILAAILALAAVASLLWARPPRGESLYTAARAAS